MSLDAVSFLSPVTGALPAMTGALPAVTGALPAGAMPAAAQPEAIAGTSFGDLFARGIGEVNQQLVGAQADLQGLALGESQNLHQVMVRLEQTKIAFQLMVQVRNRLLEAYQDVMRMQI